ncbi:MAG: pyruvate, water dikinase, partial [Anaeromyxobacter sp. RBG_16_69_14]
EPPLPAEGAARLRTAFQARYHQFKLLLNANNKALEAMARLEQARRATEPFGMPFIRANATDVSVNVAQIIRALDTLAPGKYTSLWKRLREIQRQLEGALAAPSLPEAHALVLPVTAIHGGLAGQVGSKMANLGEVASRLGIAIPAGFVVTAQGYARFMAHNDLQAEIDRLLQASGAGLEGTLELSTSIQQRIVQGEVPADLADAISSAYGELERLHGAGVRVSVRSSALGEDAAGVSFAGQYRSVLNVSGEHLLEVYRKVVASKYNLHAMLYRLARGIRDEEVAMCVGCCVMIEAHAGGVSYSQGPAGDDRAVVVASVFGLPQAVVDGGAPCDTFRLTRSEHPTLLETRVAPKREQLACFPEEGIQRVPLPAELASVPSLHESQAVAVASLALRLERHYGGPQDIEWAIDERGRLYLLQCRPLHRAAATERAISIAEAPLVAGGVTASPGAAAGPVFVAQRNADLLRFPAGAVLVAAQAAPIWGALVGRAAAVVTEQGSVTSHLASVAREFGVPALFGVHDAATRLAPGTLVTVDASGPGIYAGRVEALLAAHRVIPPALAGTPVHRVLEHVLSIVSPLNLLDPDGPDFRPSQCRTLHDITRFAHETSVREMFSFARDQSPSERSSKQLVVDVPMQLWLLDLDDGLRAPATGRYVHIEDVASVPMLALWEGMHAVPWEGPPPVDTRGFMSVMFQATANPALEPATRSDYADKNYFMVARNFCSLQSRFGFHFSTVEALVGERASENYASFSFKGGAADLRRRLQRIALVADILREHGFAVEIVEDALRARLEGLEAGAMCEKLGILGFLIVHTRQLDMVMANEASTADCREKLRTGIGALGSSRPAGASGSSQG